MRAVQIKKNKKGFTLIELIIVLAIMAIIAAVAIPNFSSIINNSKKKADTQSCETIKRTALSLVSQGDMLDGEYTITVENSGDPTVTKGDGSVSETIASAFKDVKKPQSHNGSTYEFKVESGDITSVVTGDIELN
ncbi:hypothetical protein CPJCM30710_11370 [Clostridium polyendosporum]|uniref:Prepilin-type N-terminal cleavage/methylation domain-containing protein n=1 Tax=Clostridium polyendosporum TaxID=69208 RepID=A0A919VGC2_9CLOT|nr:prepilin-type N-terminal cleavage/methylation domain-containing protein [Clostridium polyendosporum]GIM28471.1 hypothetical protein CPJCM30710_11370 [Clostridium polyendosporum]